eukprot:gene13472-9280_t
MYDVFIYLLWLYIRICFSLSLFCHPPTQTQIPTPGNAGHSETNKQTNKKKLIREQHINYSNFFFFFNKFRCHISGSGGRRHSRPTAPTAFTVSTVCGIEIVCSHPTLEPGGRELKAKERAHHHDSRPPGLTTRTMLKKEDSEGPMAAYLSLHSGTTPSPSPSSSSPTAFSPHLQRRPDLQQAEEEEEDHLAHVSAADMSASGGLRRTPPEGTTSLFAMRHAGLAGLAEADRRGRANTMGGAEGAARDHSSRGGEADNSGAGPGTTPPAEGLWGLASHFTPRTTATTATTTTGSSGVPPEPPASGLLYRDGYGAGSATSSSTRTGLHPTFVQEDGGSGADTGFATAPLQQRRMLEEWERNGAAPPPPAGASVKAGASIGIVGRSMRRSATTLSGHWHLSSEPGEEEGAVENVPPASTRLAPAAALYWRTDGPTTNTSREAGSPGATQHGFPLRRGGEAAAEESSPVTAAGPASPASIATTADGRGGGESSSSRAATPLYKPTGAALGAAPPTSTRSSLLPTKGSSAGSSSSALALPDGAAVRASTPPSEPSAARRTNTATAAATPKAATTTTSPSVPHPAAFSPSSATTAVGSHAGRAGIAACQQELQQAVGQHIQTLERTITELETELAGTQRQLEQLEEDYRFNLALIAERDEALEAAAQDLSQLYGEATAAKQEAQEQRDTLALLQDKNTILTETVKRLEAEREHTAARLRREAAATQKFHAEAFQAEEGRLQQQRQEEHQHYMQLVAEVEAERQRLTAEQERMETKAAQLQQEHIEELQTLRQRLERAVEAHDGALAGQQAAEARVRELQRELEVQQQRHQIAVDALKRGKNQEQLALEREMDERMAKVEQTLRSAITEKLQLQQEKDAREQRIHELEAVLAQQVRGLQDDLAAEAGRRAEAEEQVRRLNEELQSREVALQELSRRKHTDVAALEATCQQLREEVQERKREAETIRAGDWEKEEQLAQYRRELQRLTAEVEHWKAQEDRTAALSKANATQAAQRLGEFEVAVEQLKAALQEQQSRSQEVQTSAEAECAKLRRELHASEAARFAAEEQLQLIKDRDKTEILLQSMREEKEALARRVMELEHANQEVRSQVATFTLELQSDPVLKAAKENAAKVPALQQQLLDAQASLAALKDTVAEREAEVAAVKLQLLQQHQGSSRRSTTPPYATGMSPATPPYAQLQHEHHVLQTMYDNLRRQMEDEAQKRRRTPFLSAAPHSDNAQSSTTSSGSWAERDEEGSRSSSPWASAGRGASKETQPPSGGGGRPGHRHRRSARENGPLPQVEAEASSWRRRCLELEHHLQQVLQQRDGVQRQLEAVEEEKAALLRQVRSLTELNTFLKAQWRGRYDGGTAGAPPNVRRPAATASATPASAPPPPATGDLAGLLQQLLRLAGSTGAPPTSALPESASGQEWQVYNHPPAPPSSPPASGGGGYTQSSQALEREIEQVQDRIAHTMAHRHPHGQQQQPSAAPPRHRTTKTPSTGDATMGMRHATAGRSGRGGGGGSEPPPPPPPEQQQRRVPRGALTERKGYGLGPQEGGRCLPPPLPPPLDQNTNEGFSPLHLPPRNRDKPYTYIHIHATIDTNRKLVSPSSTCLGGGTTRAQAQRYG